MDVFSGQGDQIELIPFALSQARLVGIDVNDLSGRLVFIRSKDPSQYQTFYWSLDKFLSLNLRNVEVIKIPPK